MAVTTHTPFFASFPKVGYDINRAQYPTYEGVTNIFFRLAVLKSVLNNTSSYYVYEIDGNDTPEIVAEKVYGDSGAGWIVIYANQIVDPQFDWVLSDDAFNKYLANKYGSVATAQTTIHHYEKVVETTVNGYTSTAIYQIDRTRLTLNELDVPDSTYNDYIDDFTVDTTEYSADSTEITADTEIYTESSVIGSLNTQINKTFNTYELNDQTIHEVSYARAISNYDYEADINDTRRQIKVIKKIYYDRIMQEFRNLTGKNPSYIRTVA